MLSKQTKKIALIGFGGVGQEIVRNLMEYCSITPSLAEICVISRNVKKSRAICDDILHGVLTKYIYGAREKISLPRLVCSDDYGDLAGADMLVCCYGVPSTFPMGDRQALLQDHVRLTDEVFAKLLPHIKSDLIVINTVNPVDTICGYMVRLTKLPSQQIVGISGSHSTARLLMAIEEESGIGHAAVNRSSLVTCGEHGNGLVPVTSRITVDNEFLTNLVPSETIERIVSNTKQRGLSIFHDMKAPPRFGPAASVQMLLERILSEDESPFCASVWNGQHNTFISGSMKYQGGKFHALEVDLSDAEAEMVRSGALRLNEIMKSMDRHEG